ncbi:penicillin-binding protein [Terrilactibacillus sp. BCM23-1]|uniref:Penicillin-binding protein n=1 Tax=Terrilactibacillus tamarindi TaxID=2599694 RepID=A0A6N8CTW1_9BACI|nr:transglycosylase domain-containing protein [Terrilactibacillus tamarindi]MTT32523.1 penicillin-binding protein [Terrilactibacillus tamarindi]
MTSNLKSSFSEWFDRFKNSGLIQALIFTYKVAWNSFLVIISVIFIGCVFAFGISTGYFAALVRDQPVLNYKTLKGDMANYSQSSEIYFADNIPLGKVNSDLIRTTVTLDQVSSHFTDALLSTEDELFYEHHGVVPKAVFRATYQDITNQPLQTGGSTITQQVVKNQILSNAVTKERKAREILLAMRLEHFFSKNEILQSYINVSPFGRNASGQNIAGVQTAAQGIFGVDAKKLNIPQAAFIAGLPQNPFVYSPFDNNGEIKKDISPGINRAHAVLKNMYDGGYISQKDYQDALKYDYKKHFKDTTKMIKNRYHYVTNEVIKDASIILAKQAARKQGYSEDKLYHDYTTYLNYSKVSKSQGSSVESIAKANKVNYSTIKKHFDTFENLMDSATLDLQNGGYKIHTTINKDIYDDQQAFASHYSGYESDRITYRKDSKTGKKEEIRHPMEVGSVLIKNDTGAIISFVGGRGFDLSQYNFATQVNRQNGSTMKPLLVYAPAMEAGLTQPGNIMADLPYKRIMGSGQVYSPVNYTPLYHGFESTRKALYQSDNMPAVRLFTRLSQTISDPPSYLKKMGFTSLIGSDGYNVSAALGGITLGPTVEENTNAYATFGNGGKFVDAYIIDKITDTSSRTVYQHKVKKTTVFSPQTNYLMLDMMRDVLSPMGTARGVPGQLDFHADWAGKTGTSQDWRDGWFVATNPNVTLGVWTGYGNNAKMNHQYYSSRTQKLWAGFANAAYRIDPELMSPNKKFTQPKGIIKTTYCGLTGEKVTSLCREAGFVTTDLMNAKYAPRTTEEALVRTSQGVKIKQGFVSQNYPFLDLSKTNEKFLKLIQLPGDQLVTDEEVAADRDKENEEKKKEPDNKKATIEQNDKEEQIPTKTNDKKQNKSNHKTEPDGKKQTTDQQTTDKQTTDQKTSGQQTTDQQNNTTPQSNSTENNDSVKKEQSIKQPIN